MLEGIEEPMEASDASWLLTFHSFVRFARKSFKIFSFSVTPQIRDVTGQRQTYAYASEALTY